MSNSSPVPEARHPLLSDRNYSALKHAAAIGLPATETLYLALANIWNWPDAKQVGVSIAALNVFLGGFMKVSQSSYDKSEAKYDGDLKLGMSEKGEPTIQVALNSEAAAQAILGKKDAQLKIVHTM